ncbi:dihydrolipoamide acetyltransferase family protein [Sporichthya sp.]|uniref:dihydrolipoamide acetyltransferase family protein n=1 Tax=Sporichthya sp. TaxID=65475 RepID=UPI0017D0C4D5|nr:dihydrolipoamide acetyltransferase family protein [Sporichthya sp.]MBA3743635.1 2-oxo acid dehydrogenase subunit E2 [Sporichthya sp.]
MARRQFKLPDVGEGLTEGEILQWFVQVGDRVTTNQTLVEIETAKAAVELPSPYEGEVVELLAAVGDVIDVGAPIITIETEPDGAPSVPAPAAPSEPGAQAAQVGVAAAMGGADPEIAAGLIGGEAPGGRTAVLVGYGPRTTTAKRRPRRAVHESGHRPTPAPDPASEVLGGPLGTEGVKPTRYAGVEFGRLIEARESAHGGESVPARTIGVDEQGDAGRVTVLAKPPVRKLAKDMGVDLRSVTPTGPGGTITRADVAAAAGPAAVSLAGESRSSTAREERIAVKGVRKMTAQAMVASAFTAPHVTEFLTVDATRTMDFVEQLKRHPSMQGLKISPLLVVAKAVCLAARNTPEANATWDEAAQEIVLKRYVNLGIAAATPRGLLVPNIKDADSMSWPEMAVALNQLSATAREGRTSPADMAAGTITITNVGVFGVDSGTPIINPGESAILAFGAIRPMPWVVDGQIVPRQICTLALSFDHRIVDGATGSRFLVDVGRVIEDPITALIL